MEVINEVLSRLNKIPHKSGLAYLFENQGQEAGNIKSVAILGGFSDNLVVKYEYYLEKNSINYKLFEKIDQDFIRDVLTFDIILIGSITRYAHYKKALMEIGVPIKLIAHPDEFCQLKANFYSKDNTLPSWPNSEKYFDDKINWLRSNQNLLSEAYNLIEPESREIFIDKIVTYIRPDCINIFIEFIRKHSIPYKILGQIPLNGDSPPHGVENFFYFFNDLIKVKDNCVYVDIGAHNGDSLNSFLRMCAKDKLMYSKVFCFEPDIISYAELVNNYKNLENIYFFNKAILDSDGIIAYNSNGIGGGSINQNHDEHFENFIHSGLLSEFTADQKVDLIKWDTPGANVTMKVLAGCEQKIIDHSPDLIIGAYHNVNDIFQIPIEINKLNKNYKIYLKHNSWLYTETTYFCIN